MDIFRPDIYKPSIYDINYEELKRRGIKCLLFDLDNTIATFDEEVPDKKLKDFIMSNSPRKRVAPFKENCNIDSACKSMKPFKTKYIKIMKMYSFLDTQVACIGDQLLTDIFGANRLGLTSILVNPISSKEKAVTKINRKVENIIYKHFLKRGIFKKGEYYD